MLYVLKLLTKNVSVRVHFDLDDTKTKTNLKINNKLMLFITKCFPK